MLVIVVASTGKLFEGSISDKQIVQRSGFLETVKQKVQCGELKEGDAIMADKGFDIGDDLAKVKLRLNIPPFLRDKVGFEEDDVIKTQTIARHRIHVERAIGKVRRFKIFHSVIPVSMFGSINQIWSVACFLSNFLNPVLSEDEISPKTIILLLVNKYTLKLNFDLSTMVFYNIRLY